MRISTAMLQSRGADGIVRNSSDLYRIQQQLSTGRKLVSTSDDPVGAVRALNLADAKSINDRYRVNQDTALTKLQLAESTLADVGDAYIGIRDRLIQASNSAFGDTDRRTIAAEVRTVYERLLGLANARDASGGYLFGGFREGVQPFVDQPGGATYNGDQGEQLIQISAGASTVVTRSGAELFERIRAGNGSFTTAQHPSNTGTGLIDLGSVVNASALTGDAYAIQFAVSGGTTTYSIVNTTTNTPVSSGNPYTAGTGITVGGMQVTISGKPANGDRFALAPSPNQSVFKSIVNAIQALERGSAGGAASARFANDISQALGNLDQAIDKAVTVRATIGASLVDIETLRAANEEADLQYQSELSGIVGLDYAKAISEFTSKQLALQAARDSFARIAQRSLFDSI